MQKRTYLITWIQVALVLVSGLFAAGCDNNGSEMEMARRFRVEVANVQGETQGAPFPVLKSGVFNTPEGASGPSPIGPGGAYEFSFTAGPNVVPGSGIRLSLATMFAQSNDLYYAFSPEGLPLYDAEGNPTTGDVTSELSLYDAGTEVNQEPGVGSDQAPRQAAPNTGADENGMVQQIPNGGVGPAGYSYPNKEDIIQVMITHDGDTQFTVRIENLSNDMTLQTSEGGRPVLLSPGAFAVHADGFSIHQTGEAASEGIERIAEDGNPGPQGQALEGVTGLTVPLSPGAFAVHSDDVQLFEVGGTASDGLEGIAEDGDPSTLAMALDGQSGAHMAGAFTTAEGASDPGPIGPGGRFTFTIEAQPGDRLSLATMFAQSNDYFYAFAPEGLALFTSDDMPVSGDMTSEVVLYDAGTEMDEEPGVGLNQAPRQPAPNTGSDGEGAIMQVVGSNDGYSYPPVEDIIRVTITPLSEQ